MVTLSSFYLKIYKAFLIFIILINFMGILAIKLFVPKEKAITYDLTVSTMLIIVCGILLIISFGLANVILDKNEKIIKVNNLKTSFIVNNNDVTKVERVFIFFCKITYTEDKSNKHFTFLPSLRSFFPLLDFPQRIRDLIK